LIFRRKIRARVAAFAPQVQELQIKSNNALGYELVERYAGFLAAPLLLSAKKLLHALAVKRGDGVKFRSEDKFRRARRRGLRGAQSFSFLLPFFGHAAPVSRTASKDTDSESMAASAAS
jgi:hypothetical protein